LSHDAEDAIRAEVLRPDEFPSGATGAFGEPGRQWIDSMVKSVIEQSMISGQVEMEPARLEVMHDLRAFMFERVYLHPAMESHRRRAKEIVRDLVGHFKLRPDDIPETYRHDDADVTTQVIDYVAGMTDRFAIATHDKLFRPRLFD
jgi:dGTPase